MTSVDNRVVHMQFDNAAFEIWLTVSGEDIEPCPFIGKGRVQVAVDGIDQRIIPRMVTNAEKARAITTADLMRNSL